MAERSEAKSAKQSFASNLKFKFFTRSFASRFQLGFAQNFTKTKNKVKLEIFRISGNGKNFDYLPIFKILYFSFAKQRNKTLITYHLEIFPHVAFRENGFSPYIICAFLRVACKCSLIDNYHRLVQFKSAAECRLIKFSKKRYLKRIPKIHARRVTIE